MKAKFRIGLFLFIIVILYLIYSYVNTNAVNPKETEESILTDSHSLREDCYYLYDVKGYVAVFLGDKKTIYEYTGIATETLPDQLEEEITNGKYIRNLEELYGFLENYSS